MIKMKALFLIYMLILAVPMVMAQNRVEDLVDEIRLGLQESEPNFNTLLDLANEAINLDSNYAPAFNYRGEVYFQRDEFDSALADYETSNELDPTYASPLRNIGVWYYRVAEDNEMARDYYEQAIAADADFLATYVDYGLLLWRTGENERSIENLTIPIEADYENTRGLIAAYNFRAFAYSNLGENGLAISDFSRAIEIDPNHLPSWRNRAYEYNLIGEYQLAINDYTFAIEADPERSNNYYLRAENYVMLGENDSALIDYTRSIELHPTQVNYIVARADLYRSMGDIDLAYADYGQAAELDPDTPDRYAPLLELGSPQQKVDTYTTLLERFNPDNQTWIRNQAFENVNAGNLAEGLISIEQLIDLGNTEYFIVQLQGDMYAEAAQWENAVASYLEVADLTSNFSDSVYLDLAEMYVQLGNFDAAQQAIDDYRERSSDLFGRGDAIQAVVWVGQGDLEAASAIIDQQRVEVSGFIFALYAEATYLLAQENYADALTALDEAMSIMPNSQLNNPRFDTIIQMMRADTNRLLGNNEEALHEYDVVLTKAPDHISVLLGKAQVLIALEDLDSAILLLQDVLALDPDNTLAQSLLEESLS